MIRTKRITLTFRNAFQLKAVDRVLPAGAYEIVTDEELIESLSFPVYRRVASWIMAPARGGGSSTEMLAIDPADIMAAHARDEVPAASTQA
jgi:hypothetical protein